MPKVERLKLSPSETEVWVEHGQVLIGDACGGVLLLNGDEADELLTFLWEQVYGGSLIEQEIAKRLPEAVEEEIARRAQANEEEDAA